MTNEHYKQIKLLCYVHWIVSQKFNSEAGVRDIITLKEVVSMPGGGSLTCFTGDKLSNRKDLFTQLGWFVYYMIEGEPFNSRNKTLTSLMIIWVLNHYNLKYDTQNLMKFLENIDTMKTGNSDISSWFANNCQ